ncbi:Hypothetical protein HVIM_04249 [Roseomonas mucosa]|nr:Hypothetical protein HVIM_04249 [Roseomonas mucosa]
MFRTPPSGNEVWAIPAVTGLYGHSVMRINGRERPGPSGRLAPGAAIGFRPFLLPAGTGDMGRHTTHPSRITRSRRFRPDIARAGNRPEGKSLHQAPGPERPYRERTAPGRHSLRRNPPVRTGTCRCTSSSPRESPGAYLGKMMR